MYNMKQHRMCSRSIRLHAHQVATNDRPTLGTVIDLLQDVQNFLSSDLPRSRKCVYIDGEAKSWNSAVTIKRDACSGTDMTKCALIRQLMLQGIRGVHLSKMPHRKVGEEDIELNNTHGTLEHDGFCSDNIMRARDQPLHNSSNSTLRDAWDESHEVVFQTLRDQYLPTDGERGDGKIRAMKNARRQIKRDLKKCTEQDEINLRPREKEIYEEFATGTVAALGQIVETASVLSNASLAQLQALQTSVKSVAAACQTNEIMQQRNWKTTIEKSAASRADKHIHLLASILDECASITPAHNRINLTMISLDVAHDALQLIERLTRAASVSRVKLSEPPQLDSPTTSVDWIALHDERKYTLDDVYFAFKHFANVGDMFADLLQLLGDVAQVRILRSALMDLPVKTVFMLIDDQDPDILEPHVDDAVDACTPVRSSVPLQAQVNQLQKTMSPNTIFDDATQPLVFDDEYAPVLTIPRLHCVLHELLLQNADVATVLRKRLHADVRVAALPPGLLDNLRDMLKQARASDVPLLQEAKQAPAPRPTHQSARGQGGGKKKFKDKGDESRPVTSEAESRWIDCSEPDCRRRLETLIIDKPGQVLGVGGDALEVVDILVQLDSAKLLQRYDADETTTRLLEYARGHSPKENMTITFPSGSQPGSVVFGIAGKHTVQFTQPLLRAVLHGACPMHLVLTDVSADILQHSLNALAEQSLPQLQDLQVSVVESDKVNGEHICDAFHAAVKHGSMRALQKIKFHDVDMSTARAKEQMVHACTLLTNLREISIHNALRTTATRMNDMRVQAHKLWERLLHLNLFYNTMSADCMCTVVDYILDMPQLQSFRVDAFRDESVVQLCKRGHSALITLEARLAKDENTSYTRVQAIAEAIVHFRFPSLQTARIDRQTDIVNGIGGMQVGMSVAMQGMWRNGFTEFRGMLRNTVTRQFGLYRNFKPVGDIAEWRENERLHVRTSDRQILRDDKAAARIAIGEGYMSLHWLIASGIIGNNPNSSKPDFYSAMRQRMKTEGAFDALLHISRDDDSLELCRHKLAVAIADVNGRKQHVIFNGKGLDVIDMLMRLDEQGRLEQSDTDQTTALMLRSEHDESNNDRLVIIEMDKGQEKSDNLSGSVCVSGMEPERFTMHSSVFNALQRGAAAWANNLTIFEMSTELLASWFETFNPGTLSNLVKFTIHSLGSKFDSSKFWKEFLRAVNDNCMRELVMLQLAYIDVCSDPGSSDMAKACATLPNLRKLQLANVGIGGSNIPHCMFQKPCVDKYTYLDLRFNHPDAACMLKIVACILLMPNLQDVFVDAMDDTSFVRLCSIGHKNLRSLEAENFLRQEGNDKRRRAFEDAIVNKRFPALHTMVSDNTTTVCEQVGLYVAADTTVYQGLFLDQFWHFHGMLIVTDEDKNDVYRFGEYETFPCSALGATAEWTPKIASAMYVRSEDGILKDEKKAWRIVMRHFVHLPTLRELMKQHQIDGQAMRRSHEHPAFYKLMRAEVEKSR